MTRIEIADAAENNNIIVFERWQGWRDEHLMKDIEDHLHIEKDVNQAFRSPLLRQIYLRFFGHGA
jgi:hypothetical protein